MSKTVISVFQSEQSAKHAVESLRNQGFDNEISVIAQDQQQNQDPNANTPDTVTDGTSTGGVLGGIAGLALGAGALAVPGVGPILAAGPVAGLLSGAAAGGIAGGLADYGIPKERSEYYAQQVKQGNVLVSVQSNSEKVQDAADTLRGQGARDVEVH